MRTWIAVLTLAALLAVPGLGHAAEKVVSSKITDVVVYPNHAQITREAVVEVTAGDNAVVFSQLVAVLDGKSVRATTEDKVELTGTEIRHKYLSGALNETLADFDKRMEASAEELKRMQKELELLREDLNFYKSIKATTGSDIAEGLQGKTLSVKEWQEVMAFVRDGLKAVNADILRVEQDIQTEQKAYQKIAAERQQVASAAPTEMKEIVVSLKAVSAGRAKVKIHYLVPNATWRPVYDIHLGKDSRDVHVVGYGMITQGTGEEWDNVRMTLAMAEPEYSLGRPEMNPVYVSFSPQQIEQLANDIRGLNDAQDCESWTRSRFKNKQEMRNFEQNLYELANTQTGQQLQQYGLSQEDIRSAFKRIGDRFSGVSYELAGIETILSDRSPHKVVIFSADIPVDLHYVASPGVDGMVVRRGDIRNTTGFPLIGGESSVFVNGSYVGFANVPGTAQNEPFSIYFGPDDGLKAERTLLRQDVTGPEHFRQSKLAAYHYRLTVQNFKKSAVKVDLLDQIPMAQTQNIQVKMLDSTLEYTLDDKGILTWTTDVAAGATLTIDFSFQIEYPVEQTLYWK